VVIDSSDILSLRAQNQPDKLIEVPDIKVKSSEMRKEAPDVEVKSSVRRRTLTRDRTKEIIRRLDSRVDSAISMKEVSEESHDFSSSSDDICSKKSKVQYGQIVKKDL
jgi:hypothetical protein